MSILVRVLCLGHLLGSFQLGCWKLPPFLKDERNKMLCGKTVCCTSLRAGSSFFIAEVMRLRSRVTLSMDFIKNLCNGY